MTRAVATRYSPAVLEGIAAGERVVLRLMLARGDRGALEEAAKTALARSEELSAIAREREPPPSPIACGRGCSSCCSAKVLVAPPEIVRIAAHLRRTLSEEDYSALQAKVAETASRSKGLTRKERIAARVRCPLLDEEGACRFYEVRPIVCAGWSSIDVAGCVAHFDDRTAPSPPEAHPQSNEVSLAVLGGLFGAGIDRHLDMRPLELHAALVIALEDPDAGERWRRGEPVFEDAVDREVSPL